MRHIFSGAALGVAAALLLATAAPAQTNPPATDSAPATPAPTTPGPAGSPQLVTAAVRVDGGWRASKLIGAAVYDGQNQKIGTVDDLIMSGQDKIAVAVVSVGGFLGIGSKLVAVQYDQLHYDPAGKDPKVVMPAANKDALAAMPSFVYNGS